MYFGSFNYEEFWNYLRELSCNYILSFDGISGSNDKTYEVPKDIYTNHEYILSGNSSFKRTTGNSKDAVVYESLYIR